MKKIIVLGLLGCLAMNISFATGFTQYDLAELLINKAQAEKRVIDKVYTENEVVSFAKDHNLYTVTDYTSKVSVEDVRKALSTYESIKETIKIELVESNLMVEGKTVVDQMIANVLNSTAKKPYTLDKIQEMADKGLIGKIGTARVENGKIVVVEPESHDDDPEKTMEILKVLAAHAEANGHAVALTGGSGLAVGVAYAESLDRVKNDDYLFVIRFYRNLSFAMEQEIDGKTYIFDEDVEIEDLIDDNRIFDNMLYPEDRRAYRLEHEFMEEDVLNALYDSLRTFDEERAEDLFKKIVTDYRYSKSHQYKSDEKNEFFTLDGQLIYKDDYRGSEAHVRTTYYIEK